MLAQSDQKQRTTQRDVPVSAADGSSNTLAGLLAVNPAVLRALVELDNALGNEEVLPLRMKELAVIRSSVLNGCGACVRAHAAAGKRSGLSDEQIAALGIGQERPDLFSASEMAIIRLASQLTLSPAAFCAGALEDLALHFTPAQVAELILAIATANFLNRVTLAVSGQPQKRSSIQKRGSYADL